MAKAAYYSEQSAQIFHDRYEPTQSFKTWSYTLSSFQKAAPELLCDRVFHFYPDRRLVYGEMMEIMSWI